jgi:hypothetical protein
MRSCNGSIGCGRSRRRLRHERGSQNEPQSDRRSAHKFLESGALADAAPHFRAAMVSFITGRGAHEPTWVPSRRHRAYSDGRSSVKWGMPAKVSIFTGSKRSRFAGENE